MSPSATAPGSSTPAKANDGGGGNDTGNGRCGPDVSAIDLGCMGPIFTAPPTAMKASRRSKPRSMPESLCTGHRRARGSEIFARSVRASRATIWTRISFWWSGCALSPAPWAPRLRRWRSPGFWRRDIIPLIGARRRDRLSEALGALDLALAPDDLAALARAIPAAEVAGARYNAAQFAQLGSEKKGA